MTRKAKHGYAIRVVLPSLVGSRGALAIAAAIIAVRRARKRKESKR